MAVAMPCLTSCSSDDDIKAPEQSNIDKAKELLNGEIVLSTRATMNGVDKTLISSGCPTKFGFTWKEDGRMTVSLREFHVGTMPFAVTFICATDVMNLNSWEKDEYTGEGWVKFFGKDGMVSSHGDEASDNQQGSGATIQGYVNVLTKEIEFIVDYNMMNVRTETFLQIINKDRINHFDEEFAQYEKDLQKYKEEHGL